MHEPTWQPSCPVSPSSPGEQITLSHGEGGRLMRQLIRDRILAVLSTSSDMADAAHLPMLSGCPAVTTDSFVVSPLFFPGGDIGRLAVFGTLNDLAVSGARPRYLTLSFILEEGFALSLFERVLESIRTAAELTDARIVTGDTKVVPRGAADGLFINTTGIGELPDERRGCATHPRTEDALIVTGPIGQHGIAVLSAREELGLEPPPQSDCGSLVRACERLRSVFGADVSTMRDATRGGVAAVLHEWAEAGQLSCHIEESQLPVSRPVRGACELLGLDPLHIANEGTMVVAVKADVADDALKLLRTLPETSDAARIGTVRTRGPSPVTVSRLLGSEQPLDEPLGAPLPRIC